MIAIESFGYRGILSPAASATALAKASLCSPPLLVKTERCFFRRGIVGNSILDSKGHALSSGGLENENRKRIPALAANKSSDIKFRLLGFLPLLFFVAQ